MTRGEADASIPNGKNPPACESSSRCAVRQSHQWRRANLQMLTSSILAGWVGYVVALSQAGKRSPLHALGDGVLGLGEGSLERMKGGKGLGIVSSIVGSAS